MPNGLSQDFFEWNGGVRDHRTLLREIENPLIFRRKFPLGGVFAKGGFRHFRYDGVIMAHCNIRLHEKEGAVTFHSAVQFGRRFVVNPQGGATTCR